MRSCSILALAAPHEGGADLTADGKLQEQYSVCSDIKDRKHRSLPRHRDLSRRDLQQADMAGEGSRAAGHQVSRVPFCTAEAWLMARGGVGVSGCDFE